MRAYHNPIEKLPISMRGVENNPNQVRMNDGLEGIVENYNPNSNRGTLIKRAALLGLSLVTATYMTGCAWFNPPPEPIPTTPSTPAPTQPAPTTPAPVAPKPEPKPDFYFGEKTSYKKIGDDKYEFYVEVGNRGNLKGEAAIKILYDGGEITPEGLEQLNIDPNKFEHRTIEATIPPGDYNNVRVEIISKSGDSNLDDNILNVGNFNVADLADLAVKEINYEISPYRNENNSANCTFGIDISNIAGGRDVKNANLEVYLRSSDNTTTLLSKKIDLNPGKSIEEKIDAVLEEKKEYEIEAIVKYDGPQKETENDRKAIKLYVPEPTSDLFFALIPETNKIIVGSYNKTDWKTDYIERLYTKSESGERILKERNLEMRAGTRRLFHLNIGGSSNTTLEKSTRGVYYRTKDGKLVEMATETIPEREPGYWEFKLTPEIMFSKDLTSKELRQIEAIVLKLNPNNNIPDENRINNILEILVDVIYSGGGGSSGGGGGDGGGGGAPPPSPAPDPSPGPPIDPPAPTPPAPPGPPNPPPAP